MAFCNKCGSQIQAGTRFCNQCGAPILASTLPGSGVPPATAETIPSPAPDATQGNGNALKVIVIAVGVILLLGILGVASAGFFAWRIAHHARVHQDGDNVTVETPFGSVQTTKDADEAARDLGVDLYPGAEVLKNGAATATFGGIHTASVSAETSDSVDKVSSFYKARFPNAAVTTSNAGQCTIVSSVHGNMVTINIQSEGDKTKIQITDVNHNKSSGSSSSN